MRRKAGLNSGWGDAAQSPQPLPYYLAQNGKCAAVKPTWGANSQARVRWPIE
jgi:hypothetical protein